MFSMHTGDVCTGTREGLAIPWVWFWEGLASLESEALVTGAFDLAKLMSWVLLQTGYTSSPQILYAKNV